MRDALKAITMSENKRVVPVEEASEPSENVERGMWSHRR
jgi:hypothetical protein